MDGWLRDVRHAARNLRRTPGFALVTILTLALGIGANTAIFSVVNAVILRPLGYPHPEQLICILSQLPTMGFDQFWVSPPEFVEFQERTHAFSAVGAFTSGQANLTAPDRPRRVNSASGTAELFSVLAVSRVAAVRRAAVRSRDDRRRRHIDDKCGGDGLFPSRAFGDPRRSDDRIARGVADSLPLRFGPNRIRPATVPQ